MQKQKQDAFLVRAWAEPRENGSADSPHRYYVRRLATGEEWYLKEEAALGALLSGHIKFSSSDEAAPAVTDACSSC